MAKATTRHAIAPERPFGRSPLTVFLSGMLAVLVCLLVSCSGEQAEEPLPPRAEELEGKMAVCFTMDLAKAPAAGTYDPGSEAENHIDTEGRDFLFLFYGPDGKFVTTLEVVSFEPMADDSSSKTYEVRGKVTRKLADMTDFKMVLLANWKFYPPPLEGDDIERLWAEGSSTTFDLSASFPGSMVDLRHPVPMYGVKDFRDIEFVESQTVDLGRMHLLRAMAKIEVRFLPGRMVNTVRAVSLTRANRHGFKAPRGCRSQEDFVHDSYPDDYTPFPHVPLRNEVLEELPFTEVEDGRWIVYVPEYDNITNAASASRIRITYNEPKESGLPSEPTPMERVTDWLDFKYYDTPALLPGAKEGDAFDLLRNNWYRYEVWQNERQVQHSVSVTPYNIIDLDPVFGWDHLPDSDPEGKEDPDLHR